jgi:uncharacterized protein YlxW (UPF0749 family)
MSVTIATHNGTKVSREHNIRNRKVTDKEKHINPEGIHETWHDEKIRVAYQRIFGEAVEKYNEKQKREDRKITNYFKDVCKDASKNPVYELIVGVYGSDCSAEMKKEILKEYFDNWKERNPNLILIGAYFHFDEEGKDPHVHIDYVPIGHGYKKGMEIQVGLNRALYEQDGFQTDNRHDTAQIKWERKENAYLESLCVARGLTVIHPQKGGEAKHKETDLYKVEKKLEETQEKLEKAKKQIAELKKEIVSVRAEYEAKKEYVNEITRDVVNEDVKEKKGLSGKTNFIVPEDIWKTYQIAKNNVEAQKKAQEQWEKVIEYYPEIMKEKENLRESNEMMKKEIEKLQTDIEKMNAAIHSMSFDAQKEFRTAMKNKEVQQIKTLEEKVFGDD